MLRENDSTVMSKAKQNYDLLDLESLYNRNIIVLIIKRNLWIKDMLESAILSFVERGCLLFRGSKLCENEHLGLWSVFFVERLFLLCPPLRGSFIRGFTVLLYYCTCSLVLVNLFRSAYVSYGGLLMRLQGDANNLQGFETDSNVYLLIKKVAF